MRKAWRWIVLVALLALGIGLWLGEGNQPKVAPGSVLVLRLRGSYAERTPNPLLGQILGRREQSLVWLLAQLSKAERDERIHAVVFRVGDLDVGWGRAAEIRTAIRRLAEKGRQTVAYLETQGFGSLEYYVATGAQRIILAPASQDPFVGLAAEYLFLGGLFEKLGVHFEYERIGRYKSAVDFYAGREMSEANREMSTALIDSIDGRFVSAIAEARKLTPDQVRKAIDAGPVSPEEKKVLGLVDEVAYFDEVRRSFGERPLLQASDYARVSPESLGFRPVATFALVTGEGPVVMGEERGVRRSGSVMASETLAKALADAAADPEVRAIIFRVNSPGGSALASDGIWRAVSQARAKGKPVVASFSDVAASGGYYAACGADRIVSQPTTYTGSIGVFVLRPVLKELLEKLGVGVADMTRGATADLLLASRPLSPEARSVLRRTVRGIYDRFVQLVAEGRHMSVEDVDAVARGRVWTGEQALEVGLVDRLGGLRTAIREAKQLVKIDPEADVVLKQYPAPRPLAQQLAELLGGRVRAAWPRLRWAEPAAQLLRLLEVTPPGAPLLLPATWVEIH